MTVKYWLHIPGNDHLLCLSNLSQGLGHHILEWMKEGMSNSNNGSLSTLGKQIKLFISMVLVLYNVGCAGFPFLEHIPEFYWSPDLECYLACSTKRPLLPH